LGIAAFYLKCTAFFHPTGDSRSWNWKI